MNSTENIALSQTFLLEAQQHQKASCIAGEVSCSLTRVYTHLMAMAIERGSTESKPYEDMMIAIQELTTPRNASYLRQTQPHAIETLLSLKAADGKLAQALNPPVSTYEIA